MAEDVFVVTVPQVGVNDQVATLLEWYVSDGEVCSVGQRLCTLETTKAIYDVEAEAAGHVMLLADASSEVRISQPIALVGQNLQVLAAEKTRYGQVISSGGVTEGIAASSPRATQKALELAERLGVDLTKLVVDGIVREQDVARYHGQSHSAQCPLVSEISWDLSRQPVVIYGAGKGGLTLKECLDLQGGYQVVCFVDDNPLISTVLYNLPVYHGSQLAEIFNRGVKNLICAIVPGSIRLRVLRQWTEMGGTMINAVHPRAYIAPTARMGQGNYIKAGAIIETKTVIGDCCIIDDGAVIAHDNIIKDGCHLAPGVSLGSSIRIGPLTIVGIGASVATGVQIGQSAIISVGSSVVKDVPENAVVEGVPGRVIGKRKKAI